MAANICMLAESTNLIHIVQKSSDICPPSVHCESFRMDPHPNCDGVRIGDGASGAATEQQHQQTLLPLKHSFLSRVLVVVMVVSN